MTATRNASRLSVSLAILALTAAPAFAAGITDDAPPPLPLVQSVTPLGLVMQNPVVNARDNAQSALFKGKSIWTFGDTARARGSAALSRTAFGVGTGEWADTGTIKDAVSISFDFGARRQ